MSDSKAARATLEEGSMTDNASSIKETRHEMYATFHNPYRRF